MTIGRWLVLAIAVTGCTSPSSLKSQALVPDSATIPPAIGGGGSAYLFASKALGESRSVLIGLPRSFDATRRQYPVIIVLDGEANFRPAMTVVSELSGLGHIPQSIVVGIPNTNRLRDLTPPGLSVSGSSKSEGGDRFLDFLEKELVPALKTQFRAGGPIVLVGHSSGGIIGTYAAYTRPAFRFILSLDAPSHLGDGWLANNMTAAAKKSPSPLRYVSLESRFGWTDSLWTMMSTAAPKSWVLYRQKLENESHVSMPFIGMYIGLRSLFQDYAVRSVPQSPTTATLAWYQNLEKLYGAPVYPPSGILRQLVEDLEMEGQSKQANEAWSLLVNGYGPQSDGVEWQSRLAELAKRPPPSETVQSLMTAPRATSASGRQYIGVWRGLQWNTPDSKGEVMLRLRDSAGVIVGESVNWPAPNTELAMPLQYVKVVDGGISWGYMNGMRPRGMLLFEGKLEGKTLKGKMRFGGVRFVLPPGYQDLQFELTKQD